MYNYIKNPKTNQLIKITSKRGKNIIKKYLDFLNGGANITIPELNHQTYYEREGAENQTTEEIRELKKTNPELYWEYIGKEKARNALLPTEIQTAYHKAIMDEVQRTMKSDIWNDFEARRHGIKKIRDILAPGNNFESTDVDYTVYPIARDRRYYLPIVYDPISGERPPNINEQNQNIQEFILFIDTLIEKGNLCNIYILLGGECHSDEGEADCIGARYVPPFELDANTHIVSIGPDTVPENYNNYRRILGEELYSKLRFFNMYWWDDNIKLLSKLEEFLEFNSSKGGKTLMINFAKYRILKSFEFPNTIEKFYGTTIDNLRKYNSLELYNIITKKSALYFSWIGYRKKYDGYPVISNAGFPGKFPYYIFPFWDAFDKEYTHEKLRPSIKLSKISYLESIMYPSPVIERDIYFTSGFKWD